MSNIESVNRRLETLPNLNRNLKLNKVLGTDFMLNSLRRLSGPELGNFRVGAFFLAFVFGSAAIHFYRQYRKTSYMSSLSYHKLIETTPLNAGNQFWFGTGANETYDLTYYYRMPKKEFDIIYRMRRAFIEGEFDHDKEILIPTKKFGKDGYDIFTPFYYYHKLTPSSKVQLHSDGTPVNGWDLQKAAMPVYRGWVPSALKDRRLRPKDFNSGQETLWGTIKYSSVDKHEFTQPNDPTYDLWTNKSLHDMAKYWKLPNINDAQTCYFEEINFGELGYDQKDYYPVKPTIRDAIIEDGEQVGVNYTRNYKRYFQASSSVSAFLLYLIYLAA